MTEANWGISETDVLSTIGDALDRDAEAVLATIIGVEGSAYRRPGAKMLIEDGSGIGSLTAGCLEDEVKGLASEVIEDRKPRIETYDLTGDDDIWGMGMGCNGVITVLLEPLDERYRPVVEKVLNGEDRGVVTVIAGDRPLGERGFYDPNSGFSGDLPGWACEKLTEPTATLTERGATNTMEIETTEGSIEVFVEGIEAPSNLVVVGSGPDVNSVVELAKRVDFRVTVVTFRGALASSDNFPDADAVRATSPTQIHDDIDFDDDTYVVVMTHNFIDDRLALSEFIETPVPYLGLMGPQERFEEMLEDYAEEGITITEDDMNRIYTPIGLNLGGDSPEQIAYSIVAEVLAVANNRIPQHLTERGGPIHERPEMPLNE
ncbi:XdhC family protein (plasmid) [Halococcus dombrowskii]|uniref:XdhC family protein n=1 Tax=Halococcus dombrowskii TaxID=179637 RepID=A0AAV3SKM4_HALDO|nr:XdhC/CoxI family protein [Halococcus dombrowskii]UOO97002.1 XdhC family protein [Halococcus dombrowskii]